jgi:hypothetical protein
MENKRLLVDDNFAMLLHVYHTAAAHRFAEIALVNLTDRVNPITVEMTCILQK